MRYLAILAAAAGLGLGAAALPASHAAASPLAAGAMAAMPDGNLVTEARARGRRVVVRGGFRGGRRFVSRRVYGRGVYYRPRRVIGVYGYRPRVVCKVRLRPVWFRGVYVRRAVQVCKRRF